MSFGWHGDVSELCKGGRWTELYSLVKMKLEEHGMLQLFGVPPEPSVVEGIICALNCRSAVTDWTGTPCDPEDDGVEGALDAIVPGFPTIRLLGNTTDEVTGKPTALLARNLGYYWHQDSVGSTTSNTGASHRCFTGLFCESTPDAGAETLFASCTDLWRRLTPEQQRFVEGAVGVFSNATTSGGPAAFDSELGNLRMNATGTMRVRDATRRRVSWSESRRKARLCGVSPCGAMTLTGGGVRNLDYIEGMAPEESRQRVDAILRDALRPLAVGTLDPDTLTTVSRTQFSPDVVKVVTWAPGMLCIWDNELFLHSPTPARAYEGRGRRRMWQIVIAKPD